MTMHMDSYMYNHLRLDLDMLMFSGVYIEWS
jgi:hypothetical protein